MKVLLLGEYSNVHWTLAQGLRALGHSVTVASDGDSWKDYPRDISLHRKSTGKIDTLDFLWRLGRALPTMRGYDVVQLINPMFLELRAEKLFPIYHFLKATASSAGCMNTTLATVPYSRTRRNSSPSLLIVKR